MEFTYTSGFSPEFLFLGESIEFNGNIDVLLEQKAIDSTIDYFKSLKEFESNLNNAIVDYHTIERQYKERRHSYSSVSPSKVYSPRRNSSNSIKIMKKGGSGLLYQLQNRIAEYEMLFNKSNYKKTEKISHEEIILAATMILRNNK